MSTMHSDRPRVRAGGCPPVLAAETPPNDVIDPPVEWPPAPPTRRRSPHASTRPRDHVVDVTDRTLERDTGTEATVAELSASRAMRLLDTAIDHMRTVLETSPDETTSARVERAIGDVSRACEDLRRLTATRGIQA